jgi:glycosyltransferase involved in cell wall biosynthesis
MKPRVAVLRGLQANPWELRPWRALADAYDVTVLVPERNTFDADTIGLDRTPVQTVSSRLPGGRAGALLTRAVGERYLDLAPRLAGADIVHAAELGYWFSWQAARLKPRLGFKLALTVWETLPFRGAYRNIRTRRYVPEVLRATDVFLATTERAKTALELEGAPSEKIVVSPPGVVVEDFAPAREPAAPPGGGHVVLSAGRLVWEKGHQDVMRAIALLHRQGRTEVRLLVVGAGGERGRLERYAAELGLAAAVEFREAVPYDAMPAVYASASCLVLASLPTMHWEEQFGMVLAEAMAAHLPVLAAASGAIPEVVGKSGDLFAPGDWVGLADALAAGPLAGRPGARRAPEPERLERFSSQAAAARLRAAYDALLA